MMDYTDPATLPADIKEKLLKIRDALTAENLDEAYHVLYTIIDPEFVKCSPWADLEKGVHGDDWMQCDHQGAYVDTGGWHCPKCNEHSDSQPYYFTTDNRRPQN